MASSHRSEDGRHVVQLTGATFKKFMDKNDNVIVHFVSSA